MIDLMGSLQEEAGLVPTVACYNVVVEALAKAGEWMKALGMLAEMKQIGVRPTEFTYSRCMAGSAFFFFAGPLRRRSKELSCRPQFPVSRERCFMPGERVSKIEITLKFHCFTLPIGLWRV